MCFASYPSDLRDDFPFQYRVNRFWPALPVVPPHIRFLYVGLTFCYRLPSSVCYLPDSAESLDLPLNGRSVDFHHIDTRALLGAQSGSRLRIISSAELPQNPPYGPRSGLMMN